MFNPAEIQGDFRINQGSTAWSSSVQQKVIGANPNRVVLYLRTFGANSWDLYLGTGLAISPATWHTASNAVLTFTWINDAVLPAQEWWALPNTPLAGAMVSFCELLFFPSGGDQ